MAVLTKPMDSGSAVINSTATNFNTPAKDVLAMADRLGKDGNDPASILKLMQGELRGEQQAIQQEIAKGHAKDVSSNIAPENRVSGGSQEIAEGTAVSSNTGLAAANNSIDKGIA